MQQLPELLVRGRVGFDGEEETAEKEGQWRGEESGETQRQLASKYGEQLQGIKLS